MEASLCLPGELPADRPAGNAGAPPTPGSASLKLLSAVGKDTAGEEDGVDAKLIETAHAKFPEFAQDGRLSQQAASRYVAAVAAEEKVNRSRESRSEKAEEAAFHRFDFSGDGHLDETEAVRMACAVLRTKKKKKKKRGAGILGFGLRHVDAEYKLGAKLGQGGQGAVYAAEHIVTGAHRVVKFYQKGDMNMPEEYIQEEFALLRSLDHPNIQRLYDILEDRANIYVVSEPYDGGDLQGLIPRARAAGVAVTNVYLAMVMRKAMLGVAYIHGKQIIHCDLKEANVMIVGANLHEPGVVVIDFGLANRFASSRNITCGTPGYIPPEVWRESMWTPKGDVFSLGVMIFHMFTGKRCFPCPDLADCRAFTLHHDPSFEDLKPYAYLQELVEGMLKKDFRQRPTVLKALDHRFFALAQKEEAAHLKHMPDDVVDAICHLDKKSDTLMALMLDIVSLENLAQMEQLNTLFASMDTNGDGKLNKAELDVALAQLPEKQRQQVEDALLDGSDDGVMYTMFMGQMMHGLTAEMNRVIDREFRALDKDDSGSLSSTEIAALLKRPALAFLKRKPEELMAEMDKDHNGDISYEEFAQALGASQGQKRKDDEAKVTIQSANTHSDEEEDVGAKVDIAWQGRFQDMSTTWKMKQFTWGKVLGQILGFWTCCFWIPLVFLLGASNVDNDNCEYALGTWLMVGAFLMTLFIPVSGCVTAIIGKLKLKTLFKLARFLPLIGNTAMVVWILMGAVEYSGMTKENCLKINSSGVDPLDLTLAWFICFVPFVLCSTCISVCVGNIVYQAGNMEAK